MKAARKRKKVFGRTYSAPGSAPGSLDHAVEPAKLPRLRIVDYDQDRLIEKDDARLEDCKASLEDPDVTWIEVNGPLSAEVLRTLGERFGLHALALEDVLNRGQRPKWELYGEELFAIFSVPMMVDGELEIDQVSLFLGKAHLISFHEGPTDLFEPVRRRMRIPQSKFKGRGPDYLFYALVDLVVDNGFPVLEALGDEIDQIETSTADPRATGTLERIQRLKRRLVLLRRFIWPHRELLAALLRDEHDFVSDETEIYLRDVYDHTVQIVDLIETYREMAGSLLEIYLSTLSNRLNEVMRVLTVISTIFMPLSFLVGVYGMNFDNMPELHSRYGYPMVWLVIILASGGMLYYFRRKRWI